MTLIKYALLTLLVLKPLIQADMFTTLVDMEVLMNTQIRVIKSIQHFVNKERKRIQFLEDYLNRCKKEYETAIEDVTYYLGNPINAFTIIKRLSTDLEFVENVVKDKTGYKRNTTLTFPTSEDFIAAIVGFSRLQNTYNLNITDLANGVVSGVNKPNQKPYKETVTAMTASDCFYIGNISYTNKYYANAIPWFIEAWNKFERDGCDLCPFTEEGLLDQISQCYYFLDDYINTIKWINKKIALKPDDPENVVNIKFVNFMQQRMKKEKGKTLVIVADEVNTKKPKVIEKLNLTYADALCQGKIGVAKDQRPLLKCHYLKGPNNYLPLMRVKAETLNLGPNILMLHDVVSDIEIKTLLEIAKPLMIKNGTFSKVTKNSESYYRNAKSVSFENVTSAVVERISRRISVFTGLSMDYSEHVRIVHYGIGGIYENHFDCSTVEKSPIPFFMKYGDRIATIMIYLTNVALGGATVFPELGLSVFPKKGAALFWMNLLPSGDRDDVVIHAACPVLRGSKWIAIKWPHEVPQRFCPVWKTKRGVMDHDKYLVMKKDIHHSRKQKEQRLKDEL